MELIFFCFQDFKNIIFYICYSYSGIFITILFLTWIIMTDTVTQNILIFIDVCVCVCVSLSFMPIIKNKRLLEIFYLE